MRDPFAWSFPLVRLFGINVRMHVFFPVLAAVLFLPVAFAKENTYPSGTLLDVLSIFGLLFLAVLLHEFGHCAGARLVDGDASDILLWPLGGLAQVDVPREPRANLITVIAGPAVNLLLCLFTGLVLSMLTNFAQPPLNPGWYPYRALDADSVLHLAKLTTWENQPVYLEANAWPAVLLARFFYVNWVLLLFNTVILAFPMDGGRMLQCILWPWKGYRQATMTAVVVGFLFMFGIAVYAILSKELLFLLLAWFIYLHCQSQWVVLETGGEESVFGYDFSQGYTSLEDTPPRRRRPNFFQRWLQQRRAEKMKREQERREAEDRRMDALLEKIQRVGKAALTDEEQRFLNRMSDRYRHRQ